MMKSECVAIIGASGLVGSSLVAFLREQGHEVIPISRKERDGWRVYGDGCIQGATVVINMSGETVNQRWNTAAKLRILNSRVDTTNEIAKWIRQTSENDRPHTWLNASAVGFYGDRGDECLDEKSTGGDGFLADVCKQWESTAEAASDVTRVVCLRVGVVLAKQSKAWKKMVTPFKLGVGGKISTGRQWFPWIHIDDLVGMIIHAMHTPSIKGAMNGTAKQPVTNIEFTHALGEALKKPTCIPAPAFALRMLLGEFANAVLSSYRVDPKVATDTGYHFKYASINEAIDALLEK